MRNIYYIIFVSSLLIGTGLFAQQTVENTPEGTAAPVASSVPADNPKEEAKAPVSASVSAPAKEVSAADAALAKDLEAAQSGTEKTEEGFVASRETVKEPAQEKAASPQKPKVVFNPRNRRDPTLSPDDFLLIQHREPQRLAAIEAERQRQLAEERRRKEAEERQRQLELARLKDPTREVRNKIKIGGIIGQEVFIGKKIYTVGDKVFGARIVAVEPESVVFSYKGHKFVRQVKL